MGLAASMQASAVMTNFLILEYFLFFEPLAQEIAINHPRVEDGYIRLPGEPGLGLELNEAALGRYEYKEFPKREIARYLV